MGVFSGIRFLAYKVHIHHWPKETPKWSDSRKIQVDREINQNKENKQIEIKSSTVLIENYEFSSIKKWESLYRFLKNTVL